MNDVKIRDSLNRWHQMIASRDLEFEVMIRPASGLMALGEEMDKRVGARLGAFK